MPTTSRPDLLPFALPDTIGLPFHGLVKGGKLPTSAGDVDHSQPDTGDTNLVRHTKSSTVSRGVGGAALDALRGYAFKDYAILSGRTREIGGQTLGKYHWIYCDADYSWQASVSFVASSSSLTATVWLEKPFGLFGTMPAPTMTRRQLATYAFPFKRYNGSNNTSASVDYLHMTHSATGAITAVNVVMNFNINNDYRPTANISHSFKVTLAGNGAIRDDEDHGVEVGDGISATCLKLADAPDMKTASTATTGKVKDYASGEGLATSYTTTSQTISYVPGEDCVALGGGTYLITKTTTNIFAPFPEEDDLSGSYSSTTTKTREYFYCVKPNGTIINVTEQYESTYANSGEVTGSITSMPTVKWITQYMLYCDDCGYQEIRPGYSTYYCPCEHVQSSIENERGVQSLLTGTTSLDETYQFSFGDYTETLSYSWTRTKTSGYTFVYTVSPPEPGEVQFCAASFLGDYENTSSDTGVPAASTWAWSDFVAPVVVKSNNVINWYANNPNKLISILGGTAVSADKYVSLEPSTGTISTDPDQPICYV